MLIPVTNEGANGMLPQDPPMMRCGHAANAEQATPWAGRGTTRPFCVICAPLSTAFQVWEPEPGYLEGREARCGCGRTVPSRSTLGFFEYLEGAERDRFYCGCRGWD